MPVNVPTFTIADNGNGTATVTVAGSTSGATNTIYGQSIDDQWGMASVWKTLGSRVGNGTVSVTTGKGFHWLAVGSALSGESSYAMPKYAHITNGELVIMTAILDAVQARIRLLNLVPASRVFTHTVINESKIRDLSGGPCVMIGPADETMKLFQDAVSVMQRDDIGYPIVAAYCAGANKDQSPEARERFYGPPQAIRRAFISQRLDISGGRVFYCELKPLRPAERSMWEKLAFAAGQILMFRSREDRGLGA